MFYLFVLKLSLWVMLVTTSALAEVIAGNAISVPTVSLMRWPTSKQTLILTCSVTTPLHEDVGQFMVYLLCPLLSTDGSGSMGICYNNCQSRGSGNPDRTVESRFHQVFLGCTPVVEKQTQVFYHYRLNSNQIAVGGNWQCQYRGIKSRLVNMARHVITVSTRALPRLASAYFTSSTTNNSRTISTGSGVFRLSRSSHDSSHNTYLNKAHFVVGVLIAFCLSVVINAILLVFICVYKSQLRHRRKRLFPNGGDGVQFPDQPEDLRRNSEPTETTSMLTKSSLTRYNASRSVCSQSSSGVDPLVDSFSMVSPNNTAAASTGGPPSNYVYDLQQGRLFRLIPSSMELSPAGAPSTAVSLQMVCPQAATVTGNGGSSSRSSSEINVATFQNPHIHNHQQQGSLYPVTDSNDESGIGSDSRKMSHSDRVDLINDCSPH